MTTGVPPLVFPLGLLPADYDADGDIDIMTTPSVYTDYWENKAVYAAGCTGANGIPTIRIDPPTVSNPDGNFTELDENNNILISDLADIVVETRPDINLENFTYTNGQFSFGESLLLSFDLINDGLQNIPSVVAGGEPVRMQIVLDNNEFTTFEYTEGLAIGERRFIQVSVTIQDDFLISTTCGNINVIADTAGVVDESNRTGILN